MAVVGESTPKRRKTSPGITGGIAPTWAVGPLPGRKASEIHPVRAQLIAALRSSVSSMAKWPSSVHATRSIAARTNKGAAAVRPSAIQLSRRCTFGASAILSPPGLWPGRECGPFLNGKASVQHALLVERLPDDLESKWQTLSV
jgi:hypothetical protein